MPMALAPCQPFAFGVHRSGISLPHWPAPANPCASDHRRRAGGKHKSRVGRTSVRHPVSALTADPSIGDEPLESITANTANVHWQPPSSALARLATIVGSIPVEGAKVYLRCKKYNYQYRWLETRGDRRPFGGLSPNEPASEPNGIAANFSALSSSLL